MNFKNLTSRARVKGQGGRQNAMVALNWFSGMAEIALVSGLLGTSDDWVKAACLVLILGVIGFYCYAYNFFMRRDPDRLQSEGYNLLRQEMTLLGSIPSSNVKIIPHENTGNEGTLTAVSGTDPLQIEAGNKKPIE